MIIDTIFTPVVGGSFGEMQVALKNLVRQIMVGDVIRAERITELAHAQARVPAADCGVGEAAANVLKGSVDVEQGKLLPDGDPHHPVHICLLADLCPPESYVMIQLRESGDFPSMEPPVWLDWSLGKTLELELV